MTTDAETPLPINRLDRVEAILEALAQSQTALAQSQARTQEVAESAQSIAKSNAQSIQALQELVANTQRIADSNTQSIQVIQELVTNTQRIAESNARAIEAWGLTVQEDRAEREQRDSELHVMIRQNEQQIQILIEESRENIRQHRDFQRRFDDFMGRTA
jgi:hypothetical protein